MGRKTSHEVISSEGISGRWSFLYQDGHLITAIDPMQRIHSYCYDTLGRISQHKINEYQQLKAALPENETICFIDGVHPTHNVQPGYGWIKKGERKEIPGNTGRARLNLSGSIDVITHNVVIQEDLALNTESTIRFFQKIEEAYPDNQKIHVF